MKNLDPTCTYYFIYGVFRSPLCYTLNNKELNICNRTKSKLDETLGSNKEVRRLKYFIVIFVCVLNLVRQHY